jgi:hypothetical protein
MDLGMQDLEAAINYWRALRPARDPACSLSPEVSVLATVYALMIYHRQKTMIVEQLSMTARQLLQAWREQADHPHG